MQNKNRLKNVVQVLINNIYFIWRWNLPHLLTWKYMHKQCGLKMENVRQTSKKPKRLKAKINIFGNTEIFFTLYGSFWKHFKQIEANGTTVFLNCKYNFWISCSLLCDISQSKRIATDFLKRLTTNLFENQFSNYLTSISVIPINCIRFMAC